MVKAKRAHKCGHDSIELANYYQINNLFTKETDRVLFAAIIFVISVFFTVYEITEFILRFGVLNICAFVVITSGFFILRPLYRFIKLLFAPMSEQVIGMSQVQLYAYRARFAWKRYEKLLKSWSLYTEGLEIGYMKKLPNHKEISKAVKNAHDEVRYFLSVADHRLRVESHQATNKRIGSNPTLADTLESLRTAEELLSNTSALGSSALMDDGDVQARLDVVDREIAAATDSKRAVAKPRPHQVETR